MTTLFISHSSRDNAWAEAVRALLEGHGFEAPFLDTHPEHGIPLAVAYELKHELARTTRYGTSGEAYRCHTGSGQEQADFLASCLRIPATGSIDVQIGFSYQAARNRPSMICCGVLLTSRQESQSNVRIGQHCPVPLRTREE